MSTAHLAGPLTVGKDRHVSEPGSAPTFGLLSGIRLGFARSSDALRYTRAMGDPSFEEFVQEFRATRGCAKLAVGTPVLVRIGGEQDGATKLGFSTQASRASDAALTGNPASSFGAVTFIAKMMGAAFPDQISVGRAANTDLCLPLASISKYHAFFSLLPDGSHTITDVGSKNGTRVNDGRLTPKQAMRLLDGDLVTLGSCDFVFHTYRGFMQQLQRAAKG